ncbi:hypothetical protein [Microbacterium sp. Marseille-Q6648]|uniref:hypothetical protein n=1 Tax=Microbacterium sp. Marseille-Q6648 TaxID=2937991 RepID=UPI00203F39C6|nr:hypothetical protein [Microbacterium sp. Marseille-Q6648]
MKVDVRTPDGKPMSWQDATLPVGSALRIAPAFTATTTDEDAGLETTIHAHYDAGEGRYLVGEVRNRATRTDVEVNNRTLRDVPIQSIMQTAAPQCIALTLDAEDDPNASWTTAAELSSTEGRIIPAWLAAEVVKRGSKAERMDTIEILYGTAALAGLPPVKAVQTELDVPHRTASDWIKKARAAGRLEGMTYIVGRQADG